MFNEIASKKNIAIISQIENDIYIKADTFAIDRIINNLMDNSIKYSNKEKDIKVILESKENKIIIIITDTGVGIKKEEVENIFKPFHQLSSNKRNIQGIGMGLFIVKKIIESLKGNIEVSSIENEGTTFKIILNKYNLQNREEIKIDYNYSKPIEKENLIYELNEENINPGKYNILILDDNLDMLFFLQSSLKEKYNIYPVKNGIEGLEKIKKIEKVDIIISDVMMDEMNGYDFIVNLRKNGEFGDIPFIFLTAKSTIEEKIKGLSFGAIDYIYKPFLIEEIEAKIESLIKNKIYQKQKNAQELKKRLDRALDGIDEKNNHIDNDLLKIDELCKKYNISIREKEILILLLQGLFNKEIGLKLNISIKTVEFHTHNIYNKIGIDKKMELLNILNKIHL